MAIRLLSQANFNVFEMMQSVVVLPKKKTRSAAICGAMTRVCFVPTQSHIAGMTNDDFSDRY